MMYKLRSMSKLRNKSKHWFFLHEIVENLILGKNQEKKSRNIRGSRNVPVMPSFQKTWCFILKHKLFFDIFIFVINTFFFKPYSLSEKWKILKI
jgi:hypothetical protein